MRSELAARRCPNKETWPASWSELIELAFKLSLAQLVSILFYTHIAPVTTNP